MFKQEWATDGSRVACISPTCLFRQSERKGHSLFDIAVFRELHGFCFCLFMDSRLESWLVNLSSGGMDRLMS